MGKNIIVCICLLSFQLQIVAQNWQEVFINYNAKRMAFNPFDSTLWLHKRYPVRIKDGILIEYNTTLVPNFNFIDFSCSEPVFSSFSTHCFTPGANFYYKFDGNTFQRVYLPTLAQTMANNLTINADTLYLNVNNPSLGTLMYYQDQLVAQSDIDSPRLRIGESYAYAASFLNLRAINFSQNYQNYFYSIYPINHWVSDLNIKPGTDTLYFTAIDKILLAKSNFIVDSITVNNSSQMPIGHLMMIRFDQNGYLWAIFGNSNCNLHTHTPKIISKFNHITNTWEQSTSIPEMLTSYPELDTNFLISDLEIDPFNNVWLLNYFEGATKYFMLQQGEVPSWVGEFNNPHLVDLNFYPNPVNSTLNFDLALETIVTVNLFTLSGNKIMTQIVQPGSSSIDFSQFETGCYLLKWQADNSQGTKFIFKE